jgi:leucyl aminopeptidase
VLNARFAIAEQAKIEGFTGALASTMVQFSNTTLQAPRIVYCGMGAEEKLTPRRLRSSFTAAFKEARRMKVSKIAVAMPKLGDKVSISLEEFGRAVGESAGTVDYVMNHQKTAKGGHKPELRFEQVAVSGGNADFMNGVNEGYIVANAVNMARDLVTEPAGTMTPKELARRAAQVAENSNGAIRAKFYGRKELQRMGANALLAVARGSSEKPVLIELTYEPAGADPNVLLALVGKSVTFDSGGYDLKPAAGMRSMKCDMSGGAATLAAIQAIAALKLPVRVKVVMAATENMVAGNAYKPGDVIHTMAGLTVEVDNTDAEGRMTMADAFEFVKRLGATHIVDIATLTGAIRAALGSVGAGAFGNTSEFTRKVIDAGASVGELMWELPLWEELARANESKIADLKNSGGDAGAGSITAAHFLSRFAGETPWVHLDIAAVAFEQEQGTGWGVRTLVELVRRFAKKS